MMSLIDQLYLGVLDVNKVNFKHCHIKDRAIENRVSMDLIKDLLLNEEMLEYDTSEYHPNGYDLFYPAPDTKDYTILKICVKIFNNCINVMTVYGESCSTSKRRRDALKPKNILKREKLAKNSCRNRHY